jgi:predicted dienelactone hydrolase
MTLLAALALGASACSAASPTGRNPGPEAGETVSRNAVATRLLPLRDPSRVTDATPADHNADVRAGRELPTNLWYPASGRGPFPVVIFSHGFNSEPARYGDLLAGWAAAGFVVAAPRFPLTSQSSPLVTADFLNQGGDVSFVLTQVLALNNTAGDDLAGRVDTRHIAVAGHSFGAGTTLGLIFACCQDQRITAAVILAGSTFDFPIDFAAPGVPSLFVHGTKDEAIPIDVARVIYAAAPRPKAFLELPGGTHSEPYDTSSDPHHGAVLDVTADFLRWALRDDQTALARLRRDADRPGRAALSGDELPR